MNILAANLREGDEISWDRPERFFWLKVQDVTKSGKVVISYLELSFSDIADLGAFRFPSERMPVYAIDVKQQIIVLQQTNNHDDQLLIRR